jgi:hypothetical protein
LEVVEGVGQRALRSSGEVVDVAALIAAALTDGSATQ